MENFNLSDHEKKINMNKNNWKNKFLIILILILALSIVYVYFQHQFTQKLKSEARQVIERAEMYDIVSEKINSERSRCENFIIQEEGDFGSFEYCRKFINWSDGWRNY
jgi:uncharacterized protein YpmS